MSLHLTPIGDAFRVTVSSTFGDMLEMDLLKIREIVEQAIEDADLLDWWFYVLMLIIAGIGSFLGAYLRKKGENIATKEDVAVITKKIEDVRAQYNEQLESYKASLQLSNQLKLAALDKRLQKHQEAYTLWLKLIFSLHDAGKVGGAIDDCQNWWNKNCLYLGEEARHAFKIAYILATDFHNMPNANSKEKRKWFREIEETGNKIVDGVGLPSLGPDEIKPKKTTLDDES